MRIKYHTEDFHVEEQIDLPQKNGAHVYYRIEKRRMSTTAVRNIFAARLGLSPSSVTFPALKDTQAVAVQYASARTRTAPNHIQHKGFTAKCIGQGSRALKPQDLRGNFFTILVRDLSATEAEALGTTLSNLQTLGLPNYYDDQRFGSRSEKGYLGKAILTRDAELAVRIYLSEPMVGDPKKVLKFKELVRTHWGQWGYLLHQAPRPSNFRSVITYLKDHPHNYRKATNLIQDRLLSIYLSAYQSWIWNQIVARYLEHVVETKAQIEIAGQNLPLPPAGFDTAKLENVTIALPRLTAYYEGAVAQAADEVLTAEGLTLQDFKARILKRVYLAKKKRGIWFKPKYTSSDPPFNDDVFPGRWAVSVTFTLVPGCYATLVLKALAVRLGTTLQVR